MTLTPGTRVVVLDRAAEYARTYAGTVTRVEPDAVKVKLDAGGTFRFVLDDIVAIEDDDIVAIEDDDIGGLIPVG